MNGLMEFIHLSARDIASRRIALSSKAALISAESLTLNPIVK
jgi:hypothetical protein